MGFTVVTVTAEYERADGEVAGGDVLFTPTAAMANTDSNSIAPVRTTRLSLVNGANTIQLFANDDAGTTPTGTGYDVIETVDGVRRTYRISLSQAQPAVYLADLTQTAT